MPAVSDNRLKGNYGAALVVNRLSSDCLVRPVAVDTDVGVDLYCETVTQGKPFLHFWLQVKTGEQCKVDGVRNSASLSFKLDHLDYYRSQPVPVFAALVPTPVWPIQQEPDIYIVDITTKLIDERPPSDQRFITLWSDYCLPAGDRESIRHFLEDTVPDATGRLQVSKGLSPLLPPRRSST